MKLVDAVTRDEILMVERKFRVNGWDTTADLWRIGVNLALRVSDLLGLKYADLTGDFVTLVEGKTSKVRKIRINDTAREIIGKRRAENPGDQFLFQAKSNRVKAMLPKPLSRQYVGRQFQQVGEEIGVQLGTHSMRKTRGKAMYDAGVPVEQICKVLNHSSPSVTLRYIGITQSTIDDTYTEFEL